MKSMLRRLVVDYIKDGIMPITLWSDRGSWQVTVDAKIDTGADRSSLDILLINALGYHHTGDRIRVRNANGVEHRDLFNVAIDVEGFPLNVIATGADRGNMKYPMIIGRNDFLEICEIEEEE